ncbi:MAG: HAD-IIIA family hydrolase [Candidatus Dojkabacteria bacterium]|jgi:HAD superfamily phosphatase (TIGR01668 family)
MNYRYYIKFWLHPKKSTLITSMSTSIYEINTENISNSLVFLDIDDTLGGDQAVIPKKSIEWVGSLRKKGNKIVLVSNSSSSRRLELEKTFGNIVDKIVTKSNKPNPHAFIDAKKEFSNHKDTYMVGDRVATDMYAAYLAGIENRILVKPYSSIYDAPKPSLIYRSARAIENWIAMHT